MCNKCENTSNVPKLNVIARDYRYDYLMIMSIGKKYSCIYAEDDGQHTGLKVKINYCPFCGKNLKINSKDKL